MAKLFIKKFKQKLGPPAVERLRKADVNAAIEEFSRSVKEIAARSKQRIFEAELGRIPGDADAQPFQLGAKKHPYLFAHWSSAQKLWTLQDRVVDEEGKPDLYQSVLADPEATGLLKEAAQIAVSRLRHSRDPEIRALASTLREPLYVWLDLMRTKERGFRRIRQLTSWRGGEWMEAFMDSGAVPPDARLTENGDIQQLFHESATFWCDLVDLRFGPPSQP